MAKSVHKPSLPSLRLARSFFVVPGRPFNNSVTTLQKTHISSPWKSSENQWLEDEISLWNGPFFGVAKNVNFPGGFCIEFLRKKENTFTWWTRWWVHSNWMLADRCFFFMQKYWSHFNLIQSAHSSAHSEKNWIYNGLLQLHLLTHRL